MDKSKEEVAWIGSTITVVPRFMIWEPSTSGSVVQRGPSYMTHFSSSPYRLKIPGPGHSLDSFHIRIPFSVSITLICYIWRFWVDSSICYSSNVALSSLTIFLVILSSWVVQKAGGLNFERCMTFQLKNWYTDRHCQ